MQRKLIYTFVFISFLFTSCSSSKKISIKRLYHNTTAKYNAFYLANSKLLTLEQEIEKNHQEDYSKVIPVFYTFDSSLISANEDLLISVKEMASKAIEWHKISKWTDDSYFILGMADYYKAEFDDALNTFKYLNVNSNDRKVRHRSLAQLLRIFVDLEKYDDAAFVIDYLSKEKKISKENKKYIYQSLAYFYSKRNDINGQIGAIDQATKYTSNNKELSRLNFMLAQLYQNEGVDALAYDYYKKALKGNPPYERSFFAQLYAQKVAVLNQSRDVKKVREYYTSLYKDNKNRDLRDVILYERALFELKQNNIKEAEELLLAASKETSNNPVQKGYIYEKLAQISIDRNKDYRTAKFMVDSALMNFKPTDISYASLEKLKPKLDVYVQHFDVIQKNDSLLLLSTLSKEAQIKYAENVIQKEEEKLKLSLNKKDNKKTTITENRNFPSLFGNPSEQSFYFQNRNAIQQGNLEFVRVWGNRPIVDNWRRSAQGFSNNNSSTSGSSSQNSTLKKEEESVETIKSQLPTIEKILEEIPKTPEAIEALKSSLEESYFEIGKLLLMELKEKELSRGYLENLITEFPQTPKKPEALYLLYLGNQGNSSSQQAYVRMLNNEFSQSPFTYYVNNPEGASGNVAFVASSRNYKNAYELFLQKSYIEARKEIISSLEKYPLTKNTDKFLLLDAMIAGKIDPMDKYKDLLKEFIKQSEDKGLVELAQKMLKNIPGTSGEEENLAVASETSDGTPTENIDVEVKSEEPVIIESPYKENPNQTHIFVIPLKTEELQASKTLLSDLEAFHSSNFSNARLRTGNMNLNQEYTIFLVSPFSNQEKAKEYRAKFMESMQSSSISSDDKKSVFIISIENFQELNRRKNLEEYRSFYNKHY